MKTPSIFPRVVCWDAGTRKQVMNPVARTVLPVVFQATHHPCFIRIQGASASEYLPIAEQDFLTQFLDPGLPHVFDLAVGDSGTGKSHFIRWIQNEIQAKDPAHQHYHVVMVPRSAANLGDAIRSILKGFQGKIVERIRRDLDQALSRTTLKGAMQRVLDELAFVLDPANRDDGYELDLDGLQELADEDVAMFPAFLRDEAIRRVLMVHEEGIVARLAQHVLHERSERQIEALDLDWKVSDLRVPMAEAEKAGTHAKGLASELDDEEFAEEAAKLLNRARRDTLQRLLHVRRGDLRGALAEIRRELKSRGLELILLLEDMSVAHGLDHDLYESLLPDANEDDLCMLRSIVGITNDDYSRMRENEKSRANHIAFFNMPFAENAQRTPDAVGQRDQMAMAANYLNAARYTLDELKEEDNWEKSQEGKHLKSYCETSGCPNYAQCTKGFGEIRGISLYPFTPDALGRLYESVVDSSSLAGKESRAFNPRALVRTLNGMLEQGEAQLPKGVFPQPSLLKSFRLRTRLSGKVDELRWQEIASDPKEVERLRTALDVYAEVPDDLRLPTVLVTAFQFSESVSTTQTQSSTSRPTTTTNTMVVKTDTTTMLDEGGGPSPSEKPIDVEEDAYTRWHRDGVISSRDLTAWRKKALSAVRASIDWGAESLGSLSRSANGDHRILTRTINVEGQETKYSTGDLRLLVTKSDGARRTFEALCRDFKSADTSELETWLISAANCLEDWGADLRGQLLQLERHDCAPTPQQVAAQLLALGGWLHGHSAEDEVDLLDAIFAPYPDKKPHCLSREWSALLEAFRNKDVEMLREWLYHTLVCSKGCERHGRVIDPSQILPALARFRNTGALFDLTDDVDTWKDGPQARVKKLYEMVSVRLPQAIIAERAKCVDWLKSADSVMGHDEPNAWLTAIQSAVKAANDIGHLTGPGAVIVKDRCKTLPIKEVRAAVKAVKAAATTEEPVQQLAALARLDKRTVTDLGEFLELAGGVLHACTGRITDYLAEHCHENPAELHVEVGGYLDRIETGLQSLVSPEATR